MNRINIGSDNGLSPFRHQAIILTNAGLLSIGTLGTNFSEVFIKIQKCSFTKLHPKITSAKWLPVISWPCVIQGHAYGSVWIYDKTCYRTLSERYEIGPVILKFGRRFRSIAAEPHVKFQSNINTNFAIQYYWFKTYDGIYLSNIVFPCVYTARAHVGRFNVNMLSYQCKDSHHEDKSVWRSSYLMMEIPYMNRRFYIETEPRSRVCINGAPCT